MDQSVRSEMASAFAASRADTNSAATDVGDEIMIHSKWFYCPV